MNLSPRVSVPSLGYSLNEGRCMGRSKAQCGRAWGGTWPRVVWRSVSCWEICCLGGGSEVYISYTQILDTWWSWKIVWLRDKNPQHSVSRCALSGATICVPLSWVCHPGRHWWGAWCDLRSFLLEPKCHGWLTAILVDMSDTNLFYIFYPVLTWPVPFYWFFSPHSFSYNRSIPADNTQNRDELLKFQICEQDKLLFWF